MKKIIIAAVIAFVLALGAGVLAGFLKNKHDMRDSFASATDTNKEVVIGSDNTEEPVVPAWQDEVEATDDFFLDSVAEPDSELDFPEGETGVVEISESEGGVSAEVDPLLMVELELTSLIEAAPNGTYSFSVGMKNLPAGATVRYMLCTPDGKPFKGSNSGKFTAIPGTDAATYVVKAIVSYKNITREFTQQLKGFAKAAKPVVEPKPEPKNEPKAEPAKLPAAEKLTTGQVQALIDKVVASGSTKPLATAKGIVSNVKVDFVSVNGDYFPSGMSAIINNMNTMDVKSYRVESVEYDAQNKVSRILLRPVL